MHLTIFQDVGSKAADFGQLSGLYSLQLIIGDVILSNSFAWDVANVQLKLALDPSQAPEQDSMYKAKPEIKVILHLNVITIKIIYRTFQKENTFQKMVLEIKKKNTQV